VSFFFGLPVALPRHCKEQSDEAIQPFFWGYGLLRCARNDG
jgi:hypothetical protein